MSSRAVHNIIKHLGVDAICSALDVSPHSVRYAKTKGIFSANWYGEVKAMCDEVGIPCPLSAFNWRSSDKKLGNAAPEIQGGAR